MNLEQLRVWYEGLSKETLSDIDKFYSSDVFFKDPFNEFSGIEKLTKLFDHMFEKLDNPHFVFIDEVKSDGQAFLTWNFLFSMKGKEYKIHGSSHLKFDENSKIEYHRDYWDVGEELILKIPGLAFLYGKLRKSLAVE
ncbi:MAG: isomerase [Halobacteriovoraceae bacterium]|nr:isomerase [Halobacteriovoraceae bacterium]|tara:strand:- start:386 stop:799 length:414 start_codon:yes stop_codon:yes gene_type:complete